MKTKFLGIAAISFLLAFCFTGCKKDDPEPKNIVKLGAQANTSVGGFLSVSEKKVYTMQEAFQNQEKIDIFCFYEEGVNNIAIAGPGTGIDGIFTGDAAPQNWDVKNLTRFTKPTVDLTVADFDALKDGDAIIETYFNAEQTSGYKKAKDLKINDIYTFKTEGNIFGIIKVTAVQQGETGFDEFEYKLK